MRGLTTTALLLSAIIGMAAGQATRAKTQPAHVHGSAKLDIALEGAGNTGTVEFEAPAQSIVGFEYQAKSAFDKKKVEIGLATVRNRFFEMLLLPRAKACKLTPKTVELHREGTHSEVRAEFSLSCSQPLGGSEIRFGFTKVFPGLETVAVQLVSERQQSSETVKKDKGVLTVAP